MIKEQIGRELSGNEPLVEKKLKFKDLLEEEKATIESLASKYSMTARTIIEFMREGISLSDIDLILEVASNMTCYELFENGTDKINPKEGNRPSIQSLVTAFRIAGKDIDMLEMIIDYADRLIEEEYKCGSATDALIKASRLYEKYGERMFVEDLEDLDSGLSEMLASQRQGGARRRPSLKE